MKANRVILAAAAIGLGLTSAGSAETLYVTGSTAFRASFLGSVVHLMGGTAQVKYEGGTFTGGNRQVISGTIASVPVVVNCSWTGSVTGIQSLTNPADRPDSFLDETGLTLITQSNYPASATYSGGTANATGAVNGEADICMSDVFQNSTTFTTPSLTDNTVAVVPFKLVVGDDSTPGNDGTANTIPVDNMTPLLTQLLYGAGRISQALFTGNAADNNKFVYALGRDNGSGTRLTVMAESGKGALNPVLQYVYSGDNGTFSLATDSGNGGSGSGSGVATQLGYSTPAGGAWAIGYLGLSDATAAINAGAKELKWNGVAYSAAAVRGGQYTLWGYQHLFVGPAASANDQTVAQAIADELVINPGTAGIALGTMNVQRGAEGGLIDLNN